MPVPLVPKLWFAALDPVNQSMGDGPIDKSDWKTAVNTLNGATSSYYPGATPEYPLGTWSTWMLDFRSDQGGKLLAKGTIEVTGERIYLPFVNATTTFKKNAGGTTNQMFQLVLPGRYRIETSITGSGHGLKNFGVAPALNSRLQLFSDSNRFYDSSKTGAQSITLRVSDKAAARKPFIRVVLSSNQTFRPAKAAIQVRYYPDDPQITWTEMYRR